jgi:cold shock CspA family protein
MQGKVQQFEEMKGYGFILRGFKHRVFFHVTDWNSEIPPTVGLPVTFDTAPSRMPGMPDQAVNVKPLPSATEGGAR